jgi:antibiotic biosynthesis monooxygenase (ABM) superfamily enzyme
MRRRAHLKALVMTALGLRLSKAQVKTGAARPIQLFVEMEVDPKNEKDMLNNFHSIFVPEAKKHPGFISVKMLKFRKVVLGTAPPVNYRFELQFESEELRQKWIASPEHQRVWPMVEKFMRTPSNYPVVLFDEV